MKNIDHKRVTTFQFKLKVKNHKHFFYFKFINVSFHNYQMKENAFKIN